jgi:predicted aspartyl protease
MVVDTGADYTLLPYSASNDLEINLKKEAKKYKTFGIGGSETVYLIKRFKIKINDSELLVPVGFLSRDDIPPLLGREQCLNKFKVLFANFITIFN